MKTSVASQVFQLSCNTIDLWLRRRAETGDFQAKPNQPPGNGHKIIDWEKFREFAKADGDQTQVAMAALWDGVSARTIARALEKIGFIEKGRSCEGRGAREKRICPVKWMQRPSMKAWKKIK